MSTGSNDSNKKPRTRSLTLVLLAWVFIGGQALLAAGTAYELSRTDTDEKAVESKVPWSILGQSALKTRLVAMQAQPDVIGNVAVFLAVANALGVAALLCAVLSWSRSRHASGKLTIAAATTIILINSILILPYA